MRIQHLKVKIKSLAAEATIIRLEESRAYGVQYLSAEEAKNKSQEWLLAGKWQPCTTRRRLKRGAYYRTFGDPAEKFALAYHRRGVVGGAARSSLLAYAALRGVPYSTVEAIGSSEPHWKEILKVARTFGGPEDQIQAWLDEAILWRKGATPTVATENQPAT